MNLASLNIARARYDAGAPELADFERNLAAINGLATKADGFIWYLESGADGVALTDPAFDDPRMLLNLVVFETLEALHFFAYKTAHKKVMNRNLAHFEQPTEAYHVMWWVAEGHRPTMAEAKARLDQLRAEGPSRDAFTWAEPYDEDGAPLSPFVPDRVSA